MDQESASPPSMRAWVATLVLGAGFLAAGILGFLQLRAQKQLPQRGAEAPPRIAVRTQRARRADYLDTLRGYGMARSLRRTAIAAEVEGVVQALDPELEPGNQVIPGPALVILDDCDLKTALESARALVDQRRAALDDEGATLKNVDLRLKVARRELEVSRRRLENMLELERRSVSAGDAVDLQRLRTAGIERAALGLEQQKSKASHGILGLQAQLRSALAQQHEAARNLARARVSAPWPGTIEERLVQVGARVSPGTILFRMVDRERLEVPLTLGASHYAEVRVGSPATLRISESTAVVWKGHVARVSPVVDASQRTFMVYLEVKSSQTSSPIPPGTFVVGSVEGQKYSQVVVLPRTALIGDLMFVVERDPQRQGEAIVHVRRPAILRLLPEVALLSGRIDDGDEVVVTNLEELAEGTRVLLVQDSSLVAAGIGDGHK